MTSFEYSMFMFMFIYFYANTSNATRKKAICLSFCCFLFDGNINTYEVFTIFILVFVRKSINDRFALWIYKNKMWYGVIFEEGTIEKLVPQNLNKWRSKQWNPIIHLKHHMNGTRIGKFINEKEIIIRRIS